MKTVIYADVLVAVNVIVNYLLLRATAAISGARTGRLRMFFSLAVSGAYSLIIFAENLPFAVSVLLKILMCGLIVLLAFKPLRVKAFLRCCAVFSALSFGLAGVLSALWFTFAPNSLFYKNGAVYFDVDILTLTLSALGVYCVAGLGYKLFRRRTPDNCIYTVVIENKEKSVQGKALLDTGNSLTESISGRPVIVCTKGFLKDILPEGFEALCDNPYLTDIKPPTGFCLVPFSTVGGAGILPAYRPESVGVFYNGKMHKLTGVYVAAAEKKLFADEFDCLLGTAFFENLETEK